MGMYDLTQGAPMQGGMVAPAGAGLVDPAMMGALPPMPPQGPQQVDPQTVQALLALQQQGAAKQGIKRQQALADRLRGDAAGQLKGGQAGRVYVAPNLLNLAANIGQNWKAGRVDDDIGVREQNLGAQTADALRRYYNAATGMRDAPLGHMGEEFE